MCFKLRQHQGGNQNAWHNLPFMSLIQIPLSPEVFTCFVEELITSCVDGRHVCSYILVPLRNCSYWHTQTLHAEFLQKSVQSFKACWFPNLLLSSPPPGRRPRLCNREWINNMKVWLDVEDPDSGFHFLDREPGRCLFLLPSNFFQESWSPPDTLGHNKRADSFFPPWKSDTEGELQVLIPPPNVQTVDGQIQHYVTDTGHFLRVWSEGWNRSPGAFSCEEAWCHVSASPRKLMPINNKNKTPHQALILFSQHLPAVELLLILSNNLHPTLSKWGCNSHRSESLTS